MTMTMLWYCCLVDVDDDNDDDDDDDSYVGSTVIAACLVTQEVGLCGPEGFPSSQNHHRHCHNTVINSHHNYFQQHLIGYHGCKNCHYSFFPGRLSTTILEHSW